MVYLPKIGSQYRACGMFVEIVAITERSIIYIWPWEFRDKAYSMLKKDLKENTEYWVKV